MKGCKKVFWLRFRQNICLAKVYNHKKKVVNLLNKTLRYDEHNDEKAFLRFPPPVIMNWF